MPDILNKEGKPMPVGPASLERWEEVAALAHDIANTSSSLIGLPSGWLHPIQVQKILRILYIIILRLFQDMPLTQGKQECVFYIYLRVLPSRVR
jgi:hypothetical protein